MTFAKPVPEDLLPMPPPMLNILLALADGGNMVMPSCWKWKKTPWEPSKWGLGRSMDRSNEC